LESAKRYRIETDVRNKMRLLCIKLVARGDYTSEVVSGMC
jgi:hypothetical protein